MNQLLAAQGSPLMPAAAIESGQSAPGGRVRTARQHRVASNCDTGPDRWGELRVTPGSTMSNMRTGGRNVRRPAPAGVTLLRNISAAPWTAA